MGGRTAGMSVMRVHSTTAREYIRVNEYIYSHCNAKYEEEDNKAQTAHREPTECTRRDRWVSADRRAVSKSERNVTKVQLSFK